MMRWIAGTLPTFALTSSADGEGDARRGGQAFRHSAACHSLKPDTIVSALRDAVLFGFVLLLALSAGTLSSSFSARADEAQEPVKAEAELIERVTREVMRRLLEEGALDAQIELGIERYVEKQRRAKGGAEAEEQAQAATKARNVRRPSPKRDHIYGRPDALVSLIEYSDFECPFCKRFHPTAKRAVDSSRGQINWVYRHFPLEFHNPLAQKEAEASECAGALGGNEAFWRYADLIYERTRSNGNGLSPKSLTPFAGEIGLDEGEFRKCLEEGRFTARVQEDYDEGVRIGITGTPGNIVLNNETGDVAPAPGAIPYEALREVIDRLLEAAP